MTTRKPSKGAPEISEAMSVNEIVRRYPRTERFFSQLHVNRLEDGYQSVDELAWRHGMDVGQVIERLCQAAFSVEDPARETR